MVNIAGEQSCAKNCKAYKYFLLKGFFVNMDVYFQNMAIRSWDYASQSAIKSQNVIV